MRYLLKDGFEGVQVTKGFILPKVVDIGVIESPILLALIDRCISQGILTLIEEAVEAVEEVLNDKETEEPATEEKETKVVKSKRNRK